MAVLVYTENWDGKFKKRTYELVSYAHAIAEQMETSLIALSIGSVAEDELKTLSQYGAEIIYTVTDDRLKNYNPQAYVSVIEQLAKETDAQTFVFSQNFTGRSLAPRLSARLKAGMVIAIEPMVIAGSREIEVLEDDWTIVSADGNLAAHYEHSIAITDGEPIILSDFSIIEEVLKNKK